MLGTLAPLGHNFLLWASTNLGEQDGTTCNVWFLDRSRGEGWAAFEEMGLEIPPFLPPSSPASTAEPMSIKFT